MKLDHYNSIDFYVLTYSDLKITYCHVGWLERAKRSLLLTKIK